MDISNLNDVITDIVNFFESFCIVFNQYVQITFIILKYIFVIVVLGCGVLTLLKARGIYFRSKALPKEKEDNKADPLTKPRLIVGSLYIVFGFGILFNYFIYFLIWVLDPLPDRLIFSFINLIDIDPYAINRISDINLALYPHEKTIYYIIAMASFVNTVHVIFSIYLYLDKVQKPRRTFTWLMVAVPNAILFGFTTFMPLML